MFEKEDFDKYMKDSEDYYDNREPMTDRKLYQLWKDGAEYGYKKAMEEWKKCFLSCSSPYCSKQFPNVETSGVLGNMEKKEND